MKIGGIEAGWLGLRPQITLMDVRVYDAEGREALRLPSVENILAWRSLVHLDLRAHSLVIQGPRLAVRRDPSGRVEVAGIPLHGSPGATAGLSEWLLGQGDIEIRDAEIEWRDERRGAPPLRLSAVNLHLHNSAGRHALGLSARLPAELGGRLELRARLRDPGSGDEPALSGRVYAELGYADFAAWRAWLDLPVNAVRGAGAVRLWATLENNAWRSATADFVASDLAVVFADDLPALELDSLRGRLQARVLGEGYQLTGRQVVLAATDGFKLGPADFQIAWAPSGGSIEANAVELSGLARLAQTLPLPAAVRQLADDLEPRGQVADVSYRWQGPLEKPARFRARSRFSELGLKPWGAVPGFAGLAGSLEATEAGGRVYLRSRNAELDLPKVFPEPHVAFDSLSGQIDWQDERGRFSASLTSLSFANADLSGSAFGAYTRGGAGAGAIDLSATLTRADARRVARYLPLASIMGEQTRQWLVAGIRGGQASDVHLRLRGELADFPYADPARGEFRVTARVQDGVLQYADGWPAIRHIDADLQFERNRMDIVGRSGTILGAHLSGVHVSIPDLASQHPLLSVAGEAAGPSDEFLKYIASSPVRQMTSGLTDGIAASGDGRLRLALELPLAGAGTARVNGDYSFAGNALRLDARLPPIERAAGRLSFTEASFAAHDVRGRLFGGPVAISGGTRGNADAMQFMARGEAAAQSLTAVPDDWRRFLSGHAAYIATLSLEQGVRRIALNSSLRGVASTLPAPLAKSAAESLPLRLEVLTSEGGSRERIVGSLANLVSVDARRTRHGDALELERASVRLGSGAGGLRLPARGVSIEGALPMLDFDAWRAAGGSTARPALPGPLLVDLRLGQLRAYGKRFNDVSLRASGRPQAWSATVSSAEMEGQLSYGKADDGVGKKAGRLVARMKRFDVPGDAPSAAGQAFNPGELPAVDFVAERFAVRHRALGRVEVAAEPDGADWRIDRLTVANPDGTLEAKAWWRGGTKPRTVLDFALHARDAGALLGRIGYPGLVMGGSAHLEGSASWDGEPASFDAATLSGELHLVAEDGQFLEIDPGVGKLISLMSLQALPRRVALDFSDVFSKGFRFDRIDAASRVKGGLMQVADFRMRGPAAEVQISGSADLARETQDLRVRVVPGLGDSASTVIGIINPVMGVTAALAQRALQNPLGQIFAHDFSVTGGWADPQVTRLNPPAPPRANNSP